MEKVIIVATGGNGFLSKFQQRLRNIRIARSKKKKNNDEFVKQKVDEIHRIVENDSGTYVKTFAGVEDKEKQAVGDNINNQRGVGVSVELDEKRNNSYSNKVLFSSNIEEHEDAVERVAEDPFVQNIVNHIHESDPITNGQRRGIGVSVELDKKRNSSNDGKSFVSSDIEKQEDGVKRVADDVFVQNIVDHIHENDSINNGQKRGIRIGASVDSDETVHSNVNDKKVSNGINQSSNDSLNVVNDKRNDKIKANYISNDDRIKNNSRASNDEERKEKIRVVAVDLIERIQDSFDECVFELDVLEGEIYLLSEEEEIVLTVKKINEIRKKINDCVVEINKLIDIYNSYKKSNYLDGVVDIDDDVIVDDLISFRTLLDNKSDEKKFVREVHDLDLFKEMYQKLSHIKNDVNGIREKLNDKEFDYKERDSKYKEILNGAVNVSKINRSCSDEIKKQDEYFNSLMDKISKINRQEYVTTHLRGFGDLVGMSLRYMGLLMLNPFRNTLPGIGIQTAMTRRLVGNLFHNLHFEEVRHVQYDAVDYESEINQNISNVRYTKEMLNDALSDIDRLRDDFMLQYESNIPGYEETLKNINSIKKMVMNNQRKVNLIEKSLGESKKINEDKLILVRQMNEHE